MACLLQLAPYEEALAVPKESHGLPNAHSSLRERGKECVGITIGLERRLFIPDFRFPSGLPIE
jgi:hypothetical protein